MRRVIDFALRCGVAGVAFPGFASEVAELSAAERAALLNTVVDGTKGAVPVVAGATGVTVEEVIAHGREALEAGVTSLMIQAPIEIGAEAPALIGFFGAVADALPGATLMLQNAPPPRGIELSAETTRQVVSAVQPLKYVKLESIPSGPHISALVDAPPANLLGVLGGGGARYLFGEYQRGACGTMPAVELADLHVAFDAAFRAGDLGRARQLYMASLPLLLLQLTYRMRLTKRVLMLRGVLDNDRTRAAAPELDARYVDEIAMWLDTLAPYLSASEDANRRRAALA
jgi:4-hydroxy-tetrahydrodipicolinate synthase